MAITSGKLLARHSLLLGSQLAFTSLEEARLEVAYCLDVYFNPDRRHSALGCRSLHQFEADLFQHLP